MNINLCAPKQIGEYRIVHAYNPATERKFVLLYRDGQYDPIAEFDSEPKAKASIRRRTVLRRKLGV